MNASPSAPARAPQPIPAHFPLRTDQLETTFALRAERQNLRDKLADRTIPDGIELLNRIVADPALATSKTVQANLQGSVWGTGLTNYQGDDYRSALTAAMGRLPEFPHRVQQSLLEAVHTLYLPLAADDPITSALLHGALARPADVSPRAAAMAATIIQRSPQARQAAGWTTTQSVVAALSNAIGQDARASTSPHVQATLASLDRPALPPWPATSETLLTLLRLPSPTPGHAMVYSIQGTNRDLPGLVAVRRRDGRFVRDHTGRPVLIRQLARAQTNLPAVFTNGNTPAGYMSIQGLALTSGNVFIGPAPMLLTELPVEADPPRWFHGQPPPALEAGWSLQAYSSLLPSMPATMRSQLLEAWFAGAARRSEILLHGNVTEPGLHAIPGPRSLDQLRKARGANPWAPFGPSMGCATPIELWDENTGKCLHSDQILLVHALLAADNNRAMPAPGEDWPVAGETPQPTGFLLTLDFVPPRPDGFLQADVEPVVEAADRAGIAP